MTREYSSTGLMGDSMGASLGGQGFTGKFDNPVLLPSSAYYPSNLSAALDWCRYYYFKIPNFRQVQKRVVRWFITDFEFPGDGDEKEKENLRKYLKDVLDLPSKMVEMGDDWGCYGNAFMRFHYPFTRYIKDNRYNSVKLYTLSQFPEDKIKFNLNNLTYSIPDPKNDFKSTVELPFVDIVNRDKNAMKLIKMDPRFIRIIYNELSDSVRYVYKFNAHTIQQIKSNNLLVINTTPKYMLEAISKGCDIIFKEGEVFHFRSPVISGISYSDWGLPELMANFSQIYQIMLYMKSDEAIARDFITPFRLFSMPQQGGTQGDVLQNMDGYIFQDQMAQIIANRRKDPTAIHAVPLAVEYQEFGANGKSFAPKELIEFQNDQLLNGCGFPVELYKLSLQTQQVPTALRIMQNSFLFIYNNYNKFTKWVTKKVLDYSRSAQIEIQLQEPQMADNLENMNIITQLVMGGSLPYDVLFKKFGLGDAVESMVKRRKQDLQIEQKTQEAQDDMERARQAQALLQQNLEDSSDAQSAPGAGGGGAMPITDKYQQAAAMAQQWLSMPVGQRRIAMTDTKNQDMQLYALAKNIMDEQRSQLQSQGAQMMKDEMGYQ